MRLFDPITPEDLPRLRQLALKEHEDFFRRNKHLKRAFYDGLIAICLCQGAAAHYFDTRVGVKDFDIWHFYWESEEIQFPYRAHKRIQRGYKGKAVDFLKRAIPTKLKSYKDPGEIVLAYLLEKDTKTKKLLLEKPVISLHPEGIFAKVIWKDQHKQALF